MVDTSKATPRPWVREGRTIFALQDAKWHGKPIQVNRISASVQAGTNCDESEAEASAALIVQAVNSFDALREALSFYVGICGNTCHSVSRETAQEMYDKAISAIAIDEGRAQ